jgi:hypothetical protein
MITHRAPREGDAERLEAGLRSADRAEVAAAHGDRIAQVIRHSIAVTPDCIVSEADGELLCIWGTAPVSLLSDEGIPWLLGTNRIYRHSGLLTKTAKGYFQHALTIYSRLENYVDARNTASIRWLKRLGFALDEPRPYGVAGLPFHRFEMRS